MYAGTMEVKNSLQGRMADTPLRPEKRSIEGLSNMARASSNCVVEELANLIARLECTPSGADVANAKPIETIEQNLEFTVSNAERSLHIIQALKAKLFNN